MTSRLRGNTASLKVIRFESGVRLMIEQDGICGSKASLRRFAYDLHVCSCFYFGKQSVQMYGARRRSPLLITILSSSVSLSNVKSAVSSWRSLYRPSRAIWPSAAVGGWHILHVVPGQDLIHDARHVVR